ncbi:5105_t:CDS:2 [Acaulospora colombiana]|uniref:5105_t:CDS:1 n=1 Tax=Acaulospora colombiana TaxID=27376 RepID=A0ACA9K9A6_9GLOM|nr:5105_t:CDS:2 [Acaulospora colombiana]
MCGFGDKDRRPIDPPPVVRLLVSTTDGTPVPESSVDHSMMIVHAGLWSEDSTEERSLVINPSSIPAQSTGPSSTVMSLNAPSSTRNLMESTALSKAFAKQGIKIPIRKETRYRKANNDDIREPSNDDAPEASSSVTSTNISDLPKAPDSSTDHEGHTEEKRDHHDLSEEDTADEAEEEGKAL